MRGLMRALEAVGVVKQVDDAGNPAEGGAGGDAAGSTSGELSTAGVSDTVAPVEVTSEGTDLQEVYAAAGIAPCPYPAERLLKLIGGLSAMDPALRVQTIQAIDEADDSWTIADPLRDASLKAAAIESHVAGLQAGLASAESAAEAALAEAREQQTRNTASITQQIEGLRAMLEREIAKGAEQLASIERGLSERRALVGAEVTKLSALVKDLRGLAGQVTLPTQG